MFSLFTDTPDERAYHTPNPSHYLTDANRDLYRWLMEEKKDKPLEKILGGVEVPPLPTCGKKHKDDPGSGQD